MKLLDSGRPISRYAGMTVLRFAWRSVRVKGFLLNFWAISMSSTIFPPTYLKHNETL